MWRTIPEHLNRNLRILHRIDDLMLYLCLLPLLLACIALVACAKINRLHGREEIGTAPVVVRVIITPVLTGCEGYMVREASRENLYTVDMTVQEVEGDGSHSPDAA
jgi:hypothetical protein